MAALPPEQHRRKATTGFVIIVVMTLLFSWSLSYLFSDLTQTPLGLTARALIVLGTSVGLFLLLAATILLRQLWATLRMKRPGYALRVARTCAREIDENAKCGSVSIHAFGSNARFEMLEAQREICRARFESFMGEPVRNEGPLNWFVFGKRNDFDAFFRRAFLFVSNVDGFYVPWSTATIVVTTDWPAYRLAEPERFVRVLVSYFYLDAYRGRPSPTWLQIGISDYMARGGDTTELARLNRKMLAALSRGEALRIDELFHVKPRALIKMMRDWREFDNFRRYSLLVAQSCSIVQFLCSEAGRLERFRAFVKDQASKSPVDDVFQLHLGYGFDDLLEQWKSWVLGQKGGPQQTPPPTIRDAILERVIPLIQDREADLLERIQAVRELGKAGYALGAQVLIEVLRDDPEIPGMEVVRALESISGLALGDDIGKWTNWLHQLPADCSSLAVPGLQAPRLLLP